MPNPVTPLAFIAHVPTEWKGVNLIHTPGGTQDMLTLTEQGFYFFVNRSDKPKALPLQKWVAGEVLPSIRKTGSYSLPGAQPQPQNAVLAAQLSDLLAGKVLVDFADLQTTLKTLYTLRSIFEYSHWPSGLKRSSDRTSWGSCGLRHGRWIRQRPPRNLSWSAA